MDADSAVLVAGARGMVGSAIVRAGTTIEPNSRPARIFSLRAAVDARTDSVVGLRSYAYSAHGRMNWCGDRGEHTSCVTPQAASSDPLAMTTSL